MGINTNIIFCNLTQIDVSVHILNASHQKGSIITLATHISISGTSSTLIDNTLTNDLENTAHAISDILINDISDHKKLFFYFKKITSIMKNNIRHLQKLKKEMKYPPKKISTE